MERKQRSNEAGLFPNYFKKIGIALMVLGFVPAIVVKTVNIELVQSQKDVLRMVTLNSFILGLFFVAWSKDKIEDEMTVLIKLKSLAFAFSWGVIYVIIKPITDLLFENPIEGLSAQSLLMSMLFVYLFMYFLQKQGR